MLKIKKGDTVKVIAGKDKGKTGEIIQVLRKEDRVIVEGVNMVTKHVKPRKQGDQGGIVKAEGAMYASKVMLYCAKCKKPTRISKKANKKGELVRVCTHCGAEL